MHELVLVLSDFYVSQEALDRELPVGFTLPGFQHVARFGTRSKSSSGWRPWLSRWLTGADAGAIATVAAASTRSVPLIGPATAEAVGVPQAADVGAAQAADIGAAQAADIGAARAMHIGAANIGPASIGRAGVAGTSMAPGAIAWMATPMHLIAGMTSVHVDRRSILRLDAADQTALANDFQRVFHDSGFRLQPLEGGDFLMLGPEMPLADIGEPARALGGSMEQHADSSIVLRRLGAEIEMWLHDHPMNDGRRRRGELPVTSLWLWGAGAVTSKLFSGASSGRGDVGAAGGDPAAEHVAAGTRAAGTRAAPLHVAASDVGITRIAADVPSRTAATGNDSTTATANDSPAAADGALAFGRDSYLQGLWATRGAKVAALPEQLADVFGYPHAQRAVLVVEIGVMLQSNPRWTFFEAVADIDRRFVAPAVEAVNRGQCQRLVVLANDYQLTLRASDRLKFWRRTPPGLSGLQ